MRHGAVATIPLGVAIVPFGLVYGVAVAESAIGPWLGVSASLMIAGAAQLTLLSLVDEGAAWPVAVGAALFVNARFALYSTALAPFFREFPTRWSLTLPYMLTDQVASLSLLHFESEHDPTRRRWWFLGSGLLFATCWWSGTLIGYFAGGFLPEQLAIGFAVPAMFVTLLVPSLADRPTVIAAGSSAVLAVAARGLPTGLNVIAAALAGIAIACSLDRRRRQTSP